MKKKIFSELTDIEKQRVYDFVIKSNKDNCFKTHNELINHFEAILFEYGKTLFTFWENFSPVATIGAVVKDAKYKEEIFFTAINIDENYLDNFKSFLQEVENSVVSFPAKTLKLGINAYKTNLTPFIEDSDYKDPYNILAMKYIPNNELKEKITGISFENLNNSNKEIYKKINNSAFLDCPNGGVIGDKEIDDIFKTYKEAPELIGLFKYNENYTGTYELSISKNSGTIESISISPYFQGKGLGKLLLKSVIQKLQQHGVDEIKLIVVSTNKKAFELYRKYGFKEDGIKSIWFTKII